jgi:hypothetical protein
MVTPPSGQWAFGPGACSKSNARHLKGVPALAACGGKLPYNNLLTISIKQRLNPANHFLNQNHTNK